MEGIYVGAVGPGEHSGKEAGQRQGWHTKKGCLPGVCGQYGSTKCQGDPAVQMCYVAVKLQLAAPRFLLNYALSCSSFADSHLHCHYETFSAPPAVSL